MTTILQLFPARVAIGRTADGKLIFATPEFLRALDKVFERVGGAAGASTTDLGVSDDEDSGLEEFRHEQFKHNDATDMAPPLVVLPADFVEHLQTEVSSLREELALVRTQINNILQGVEL